MSSTENSILLTEKKVSDIMKDIRFRIESLFDKYTDDDKKIPSLPPYEELMKSDRKRYELSKSLTDCIDELNSMKLRISIVRRSLDDFRKIQATRSDYSLVTNFKKNLESWDEELSGYRFDLSDLIKNANNKLRVLESVAFYNE
jgi:hypothetical protein